MKGHFLTGIFLLIFNINSFAQRTYIDAAPSGKANYLPVEGGAIHMHIDSTTSLKNLIDRLFGDWQFIETGKMYWIGYTNDMFSIAARGDSAIGPLVKVVENSSRQNARLGAIYTLHLIGIERRIIGRGDEPFVNPKARKALLYLLKYGDLQPTIMELLIRDPWKSDVTCLIETMRMSGSDCWAIVGALNQYKVENAPVHQRIPESIADIVFKVRYGDSMVWKKDFDFEGQMREALDSIIALRNSSIWVDTTLLNRELLGNVRYGLGKRRFNDGSQGTTIGELLDPLEFHFMFKELGYRYQYYVDRGKVYICSADSAKKRWIGWWANLNSAQREGFAYSS
jgi:hypothetical protein